ncbi:MAG: hypothetical protein HC913_03495 [Microscillaceae bacterium]|nr:hypothetical protein [Microscillaceae bacterium]
MTYSGAARVFGHEHWLQEPKPKEEVLGLFPGLRLDLWTQTQLARAYVLLSVPPDIAPRVLKQLQETADNQELLALYAAFPLLPSGPALLPLATEAVRSNMRNVFEAIALHNPYPAQYFDEAAWNQLYLKAAFINCPLTKIYGLAERANASLSRILSDFAHERWAAGRNLAPDAWQVVFSFVEESLLPDLEHLFIDADIRQQQAATLVCYQNPYADARLLLEHFPMWTEEAQEGELTWPSLAQSWYEDY